MKFQEGSAVFFQKYGRYLITAAVLVVFIAVLASCANQGNTEDGTEVAEGTEPTEKAVAEFELDKEMKEDAIPELNELINAYYTAYAKDDLENLETLAYPMSDSEKSYIGVFSQYIKKYKNIKCYTKSGLTEGSYLVSAYYELQFYGVKTLAHGLDFFYVETDDQGKLFINNRYSSFNLSHTENELDPSIHAAIIKYGEQDDVLELSKNTNSKYEEALAGDVDLAKMISTTIPAALKDWQESVAQKDTASTEQPAGKEDASGKATEVASKDKDTDTEKTDKKDTDTGKADKKDTDTEKTDKKDTDTGKADKKDTDTEKTDKKDTDTGKADKKDTDTEKTDKKDTDTGKTDKKNTDTEKADKKDTEKKDDSSKNTDSKKKKTTKVRTTDQVFIRSQPSTESEFFRRADIGDEFTKISESDGWTKIKYKEETAYIKSEYLEEVSE